MVAVHQRCGESRLLLRQIGALSSARTVLSANQGRSLGASVSRWGSMPLRIQDGVMSCKGRGTTSIDGTG